MKKEIVDSKIDILVKEWRAANAKAWDTVGRPGPNFVKANMVDSEYINQCWAEHYAKVEADEASATQDFWAALKAAPLWLRLSRPWLSEAWEGAFVDARHGYYVGHHAMPFIEDVYRRMGI